MAIGTREIAATSEERVARPPPGRLAAARGVVLAVAGGALVWAVLAAAYVLTR